MKFQVTFSKPAGRHKTGSVKVLRMEGGGYYIEKYFRYNVNDGPSFTQAMAKAREYIATQEDD